MRIEPGNWYGSEKGTGGVWIFARNPSINNRNERLPHQWLPTPSITEWTVLYSSFRTQILSMEHNGTHLFAMSFQVVADVQKTMDLEDWFSRGSSLWFVWNNVGLVKMEETFCSLKSWPELYNDCRLSKKTFCGNIRLRQEINLKSVKKGII